MPRKPFVYGGFCIFSWTFQSPRCINQKYTLPLRVKKALCWATCCCGGEDSPYHMILDSVVNIFLYFLYLCIMITEMMTTAAIRSNAQPEGLLEYVDAMRNGVSVNIKRWACSTFEQLLKKRENYDNKR